MSGTFRIRLEANSSIVPGFSPAPASDLWWGIDFNANILTAVNDICAAISGEADYTLNGEIRMQFVGASQASLRFDTSGVNIILDGGSPTDFNSLPAGFVALTAKVVAEYFQPIDPATFELYLQQDNVSESTAFIPVENVNTRIEFPYVISGGIPSMSDIVNGGCGSRLVLTSGIPASFFTIKLLEIEGTYEIQGFTFDFTLLTPDGRISAGDTLTIVDPTGNLDNLISVSLNWSGGPTVITNFTNRTPFSLQFIIPNFGTDQTVSFTYATEFSGSTLLVILPTIFYINPSGLYELNPLATSDTLYLRDSDSTIEVKIPNPFIKTGFIGG